MQTVALEALEGLTVHVIWPSLLHSLWIGVVCSSLIALLLQNSPKLSHRAAHAACAAGLVLAITGPFAVTLFQHAIGSQPGRADATGEVIMSGTVSQRGELSAPGEPLTGGVPGRAARRSRPGRVALAIDYLSDVAQSVRRVRPVAVSSWLAGVSLCGAVFAFASAALGRLRREAKAASPRIQRKARVLARRIKLRASPIVLVHPGVDEPFVCGLFRPAILLPEPWLAASRDDLLESVLAHELAHARRLDHVANLAQRLVEVMLFFNPGVHWLSRSLRRHREFCTDQMAVRITGDPLALATALESVARLQLTSRRRSASGTSLGGQTAALLPRIEELIGMMPSHSRPRRWPFFALPVAGLIALVATSSRAAQDPPSARANSTVAPSMTVSPGQLPPQVERWNITASRGPKAPADINRQIAYDVRLISLDAEPWREQLEHRLELIQQDADVSAWIADETAIQELMKCATVEVSSNVLHAPRTTAFEGNSVTIRNRDRVYYVAGIETEKSMRSSDFGVKPIVKSVDTGFEITLAGAHAGHGTQFSVDLRDSSLLVLRSLVRRDHSHDQEYALTYQVPTMIERRFRNRLEVRDGSGVLISLGLSERPRSMSKLAIAASNVLGAAGVPRLEPRNVTTERLVVVIPRRIVLEDDEEPIKPKVESIARPIER